MAPPVSRAPQPAGSAPAKPRTLLARPRAEGVDAALPAPPGPAVTRLIGSAPRGSAPSRGRPIPIPLRGTPRPAQAPPLRRPPGPHSPLGSSPPNTFPWRSPAAPPIGDQSTNRAAPGQGQAPWRACVLLPRRRLFPGFLSEVATFSEQCQLFLTPAHRAECADLGPGLGGGSTVPWPDGVQLGRGDPVTPHPAVERWAEMRKGREGPRLRVCTALEGVAERVLDER